MDLIGSVCFGLGFSGMVPLPVSMRAFSNFQASISSAFLSSGSLVPFRVQLIVHLVYMIILFFQGRSIVAYYFACGNHVVFCRGLSQLHDECQNVLTRPK